MAGSTAQPAAPVSRRPVDSPFYQQRLKAWQPILTPKWVVITFLVIGIPFVAIGFWLKSVSDNVVEYKVQYDGAGTDPAYAACQLQAGIASASCSVTFSINSEMKGSSSKPVYVYYELDNFYQNHRRYVKSRSEKQLTGGVTSSLGDVALADCDPLRTRNGSILQPCGLVAQSYFNDTFVLASVSSNLDGLNMSETGITWKADRDRFKGVSPEERAKYVNNTPSITWINEVYPNVSDVTNEHFIAWMRPAALPHFRKLYGKLERDLPANSSLTFALTANYPVAGFEGRKWLVLSTSSVIGGKNPFLGIAYIVVGFACIGVAALFALRAFFGGRPLGDTASLVWPKK